MKLYRFAFAVMTVGSVCAQTKPAATKPTVTSAPRSAAAKPAAAKPKPASAKPAISPKDGKVVLTVAGEPVTEKEFDAFMEAMPEQYRGEKRDMAEKLARVKLLALKARKEGFDQDAKLKAKMAFQLDNMLAGAYFQDMQAKAVPDEAAMRAYYEERKREFDTATARHILIRAKGSPAPVEGEKKELTEEEALAKANEIRKKILGGADFAAVAKEESDDRGSGVQGGQLGSFPRGRMVPAFEEAAFSLAIGDLSEPVKTQFGYHLIKVEKRSGFEEAKEQVAKRMKAELANKAIEDLRTSSEIKFDDAYFGPAQPKVELMRVP